MNMDPLVPATLIRGVIAFPKGSMIILAFILLPLVTLIASLIAADQLLRRNHPVPAFLTGIVSAAAVGIYLYGSLQSNIQKCQETACADLGLPVNCPEALFGCTEWSFIAYEIIIAIVLADLAIFVTGFIVMVVRRRKGRS